MGMGGKVPDDGAQAQQHRTGVRSLADDQRNWQHTDQSPTGGSVDGWTDAHYKATAIVPGLSHEVKG